MLFFSKGTHYEYNLEFPASWRDGVGRDLYRFIGRNLKAKQWPIQGTILVWAKYLEKVVWNGPDFHMEKVFRGLTFTHCTHGGWKTVKLGTLKFRGGGNVRVQILRK